MAFAQAPPGCLRQLVLAAPEQLEELAVDIGQMNSCYLDRPTGDDHGLVPQPGREEGAVDVAQSTERAKSGCSHRGFGIAPCCERGRDVSDVAGHDSRPCAVAGTDLVAHALNPIALPHLRVPTDILRWPWQAQGR